MVLSGGGARGGAHIGALRELERSGIPIDLVVGTSFGALVGGLYSAGYSTDDLELILGSIAWNRLLTNASPRKYLDIQEKARADRKLIDLQVSGFNVSLPSGLQGGQKIQQLFDRLLAHASFEAGGDFDRLPTAFRAVATDAVTGDLRVFDHGWLSTAIRASAAIPGMFAPVRVDGALLVDGGILDNLPADIARAAGAGVVIAIDVTAPLKQRPDELASLIDVLDQVIGFETLHNRDARLKHADLIIAPVLEGIEPTDFAAASSAVNAGAEAVRQALPAIRKLLSERSAPPRPPIRRASRLDPATFEWERSEYSPAPIQVNDVQVKGLVHCSTSVVWQRVAARPGSQVTPGSIDREVSNLYGTGLFLGVAYRLERIDQKNILTFEMTEKPSVVMGIGLRYDRDYQLTAAIDLLARHARGTRSDLSFRALVGNAAHFDVAITRRPANDFILSVGAQYLSQPRLTYSGGRRTGDYADTRYGLYGRAQYPVANFLRLELMYRRDAVRIQRDAGGETQDRHTLAGLSGAVELDTLDESEFPTSGSRGRAVVEWFDPHVGSTFAYRRGSASLQQHISVGAQTLSASASGGVIRGRIPSYDRFFVGGAQYFAFSSLRFIGLRRDEFAVGSFAAAEISVRRRLMHSESSAMAGAYLTASYATGLLARETAALRNGDPIHAGSVGLALDVRYLGPVRFEAGRVRHSGITTYLSIGHSF